MGDFITSVKVLYAVLIQNISGCWQVEQTYPLTVDFYHNSLGEEILDILELGVDGVIRGCARGEH